jgi:hypothetical protein
MLYFTPERFSRRWTAATSLETEAVGVPMGMRQKSAVQEEGVGRVVGLKWDIVLIFDGIRR